MLKVNRVFNRRNCRKCFGGSRKKSRDVREFALRNAPVHNRTVEKTFEIEMYSENKIGRSIYDLLPGVEENTFK